MSGTGAPWRPVQPPADADAAAYLDEWLGCPDHPFNAVGIDLRGADLSGGDLTQAWLSQAVLVAVGLRGADLHRAHLESADLTDADLTAACLSKATLDEARLHRARFDGADLTSASLYGVDARSASFRGARFLGASVLRADFRGAVLSMTVIEGTSFQVRLDDHAALEGLSGSLYGPVTVTDHAGERDLDGPQLADWLAARGARVEVLPGASARAGSRRGPENVGR